MALRGAALCEQRLFSHYHRLLDRLVRHATLRRRGARAAPGARHGGRGETVDLMYEVLNTE